MADSTPSASSILEELDRAIAENTIQGLTGTVELSECSSESAAALLELREELRLAAQTHGDAMVSSLKVTKTSIPLPQWVPNSIIHSLGLTSEVAVATAVNDVARSQDVSSIKSLTSELQRATSQPASERSATCSDVPRPASLPQEQASRPSSTTTIGPGTAPADPQYVPFAQCTFVLTRGPRKGNYCLEPCVRGDGHQNMHRGSCRCQLHFRNLTSSDDAAAAVSPTPAVSQPQHFNIASNSSACSSATRAMRRAALEAELARAREQRIAAEIAQLDAESQHSRHSDTRSELADRLALAGLAAAPAPSAEGAAHHSKQEVAPSKPVASMHAADQPKQQLPHHDAILAQKPVIPTLGSPCFSRSTPPPRFGHQDSPQQGSHVHFAAAEPTFSEVIRPSSLPPMPFEASTKSPFATPYID